MDDEPKLDPRFCQKIHPTGHPKAGTQCQGTPSKSTGYCAGHAGSLGLLEAKPEGREGRNQQPDPILDAARDLANRSESAAQSLDADLARWLEAPGTRRRLRRRWDEILDKGGDAELLRLLKEMMDRVYGRASEAREQPQVTIPQTVRGIRAMGREERRAALVQLEATGL